MPCRSGSPHGVRGAGPGFFAVSFFGAGSPDADDWPATKAGANLTRAITATRTPMDVSNRRLMNPSLPAHRRAMCRAAGSTISCMADVEASKRPCQHRSAAGPDMGGHSQDGMARGHNPRVKTAPSRDGQPRSDCGPEASRAYEHL